MTSLVDPSSSDSSKEKAAIADPSGGSFWARLLRDDLVKHTGILFSGMMLVHSCSVVFQMAMRRVLPIEEYNLLLAFLAWLTMIQRPATTLNAGISHYSSLLKQEGRLGDIKRLLTKWLSATGATAILLGVSVFLFRSQVATFLDMNREEPVVIMSAIIPALFWLPILGGAVQGLEMFKWRSAAMSLGALARVALGVGLVLSLYRACGWAMLGHGASLYISTVILLLALAFSLWGTATSTLPLPSLRFYLIQSFLVQGAYAVLMTADVVLVRHYLSEDPDFGTAAMISRMVVFLPVAIAVAMFPKVTSGGTMSRVQRSVFLRSLGYTALCVVAGILVCGLAGGLVARVFGVPAPSDYLKNMITLMAVAMGFSALLNVLLQFLVAQRRFNPAYTVIGFALAYLGSATLFHNSSWQIASASVACNAGAVVVLLVFLWRKRWFAHEIR